MKRSIKSFIAVSIILTLFRQIYAEQLPAKKTLKMAAWREKELLKKNASPAQKSIPSLEQKYKAQMDLKREASKKLHDAAVGYAADYHNNSDNFEYDFCQHADSVVNLLKTAEESNLRIDSLYCSLRILVNASKSCEYIRDCSLNSIFEGLDKYSKKYFSQDEDLTQKKKLYKQIESAIYDFTKQSTDLTLASPGAYSAQLATQVFKLSNKGFKTPQIKEWQDRLRNLIFNFLEIGLNKTLWDVADFQGIWDSVMSSANSLYQLAPIFVHMDHLDDLLWTLTRRFIWFLDFSAGQLPSSFYENIEDSINDGSTFFLELGEQDDNIDSKKTLLLKALRKAKKKTLDTNIFKDLPETSTKVAALKDSGKVLMEPLSLLFEESPKKPSLTLAKNEPVLNFDTTLNLPAEKIIEQNSLVSVS